MREAKRLQRRGNFTHVDNATTILKYHTTHNALTDSTISIPRRIRAISINAGTSRCKAMAMVAERCRHTRGLVVKLNTHDLHNRAGHSPSAHMSHNCMQIISLPLSMSLHRRQLLLEDDRYSSRSAPRSAGRNVRSAEHTSRMGNSGR